MLEDIAAATWLFMGESGRRGCPSLRELVDGNYIADYTVINYEREVDIRCKARRIVVRSRSGLMRVREF